MGTLIIVGIIAFVAILFAILGLKTLSSTYKCNFLGADNKQ